MGLSLSISGVMPSGQRCLIILLVYSLVKFVIVLPALLFIDIIEYKLVCSTILFIILSSKHILKYSSGVHGWLGTGKVSLLVASTSSSSFCSQLNTSVLFFLLDILFFIELCNSIKGITSSELNRICDFCFNTYFVRTNWNNFAIRTKI